MKKIKICLIVISSIFIISCESNTYSEISPPAGNPTYVANIEHIMEHNCLSCHSGTASQYPNLETYEGVKNACTNANLICRIESNNCGERMPQGGSLPQSDIDMIKLWAANGFIKE
ncbi:c-type cytochrome [Flavobacterium mesophilum]|uniref:c-type cytochrome n=1 Tax=Flavobacterium mesophilum TaxID=3143495 RepID=UPI0031E218F8